MESSTASTATTKSKKEKKTTDEDFLKEVEANVETLDETKLRELLDKYSPNFHPLDMKKISTFNKFKSFFRIHRIVEKPIGSPEQKADEQLLVRLLPILYNGIFPLKSSYTPDEIIKDIKRNDNRRGDIDNQILKARFEHYIHHISPESIDKMTQEEKNKFLKELYQLDIVKLFGKQNELFLIDLLTPKSHKEYELMSLIPPHPEQLNTLPTNVPIYFYGGHGADLCDKENKKVLEDIVPNNCMLITSGLCGRTTGFTPAKIRFFQRKDEASRKILRYPYFDENRAEIASFTEVPQTNIHVKFPGDNYTVSVFNPFSVWVKERYLIVGFSGLCEKRAIENRPVHISKDFEYYFVNAIIFDIIANKLDYPFQTDKFVELLKNKLEQGRFDMEYKYIRENVRMKVNSPSTQLFCTKLAETVPEIKTKDDLVKHIEPIFLSVSVRELLDFYYASVFPTPALVYKVAEDLYLQKKKKKAQFDMDTYLDGDILKRLGQGIEDEVGFAKVNLPSQNDVKGLFKLPNIMKHFPGIHYFTICRAVPTECEKPAELRRTYSGEQETKRRESVYEKSLTQAYRRDSKELNSFPKLRAFADKYASILVILSDVEKREYLAKLYRDFLKVQKSWNGSGIFYPNPSEPIKSEVIHFFNTLYPLEESYMLEIMLDYFNQDLFNIQLVAYEKIKGAIEPLRFILESRGRWYANHLSLSSIGTLAPEKKEELLSSFNKIKEYFPPLFTESLIKMLSAPPPQPNIPSIQVSNLINRKGGIQTIKQKLNEAFTKQYTNTKDLVFMKRQEVIRILKESEVIISLLSDDERKELLKMLIDAGLIARNPSFHESKWARHIRHLVWPSRYKNQFGGTRKKQKKVKRHTRKH